MPPAKPGDWLNLHKEEGQTFKQYLACKPTLPRGQRTVLYIQPVGEFAVDERRIVELTWEFMGLFYNLPVRTLPDLSIHGIPVKARRVHPTTRDSQVLTSYVLKDLLKPRLPSDAAAMLALTTSDLWPGEGWNFVFGQASLSERVGVWSIRRYGDPSKGPAAFRLCLRRAIATAAHETGHMFSIRHCIRYGCTMNGSESLEESDRQPLELCPECLAKVCWATRTPPLDRFHKLAEFCEKTGLLQEGDFLPKVDQGT